LTVLPIVISIPHGGTSVPPEVLDRVCLTPRDLFDDGDAFTGDIYGIDADVPLVLRAEVARAFVDLNRAPTDRPPTHPDGVVKAATCYGRPIYPAGRELPPALVEKLLRRYYVPYHSQLENASRRTDLRLGLDCHSMAAVAPPVAPDPGEPRPLFCLSNGDGCTCPTELLERFGASLADSFECRLEAVGFNAPFKGGYVTRHYGGRPLPWIQVEMNRSWYLDPRWFDAEALTVDHRRIEWLRDRFRQALRALAL